MRQLIVLVLLAFLVSCDEASVEPPRTFDTSTFDTTGIVASSDTVRIGDYVQFKVRLPQEIKDKVKLEWVWEDRVLKSDVGSIHVTAHTLGSNMCILNVKDSHDRIIWSDTTNVIVRPLPFLRMEGANAMMFDSITLTATLSHFEEDVNFRWTNIEFKYTTSDGQLKTIFAQPGDATIVCEAIDAKNGSVVAKDSLMINVSRPALQLDLALLHTFPKVVINGYAMMTCYMRTSEYSCPSCGAGMDIQKWTDSGSYSEFASKTVQGLSTEERPNRLGPPTMQIHQKSAQCT